jgi:hypothetical protein
MAGLYVADGGDGLQIWNVSANILNKQSRTADKGWSYSWGLGVGLTTPLRKNKLVTKIHKKPRTWTNSFDKRPYLNWMLRKILGLKRDEVTGGWRKLHNEKLHNVYSSPNIIGIIKSRRMRRAGHVARMGRRQMHRGYWWESQKESDCREVQDVGV